jgi:hypothetical protein
MSRRPIVLPPALPDGGTALGLRHDGGKAFARGAFPVRDVDDRKVGAIYVLRDVTDVVADARRVQRDVTIALASAALGVAAVIGVAFELLVVRAIGRRAPTSQ